MHALRQADGIDVNVGDEHSGPPLLCTISNRDDDWWACARALASAEGIDLDCHHERTGRTALHEICAIKHAALAGHQ